MQFHGDCDGASDIFRNGQFVVGHLSRTRRDLLVVKGSEDILRVAAIDPIAIAIEHEDIDEVRPRIDLSRLVRSRETSVAADHFTSSSRLKIDPNLV